MQRKHQAGCLCSERRQSCTKPYERNPSLGVSEEFLRAYRKLCASYQPAAWFHRVRTYHIGNDQVITISTFGTQAGAEKSVLLAPLWVQEHCVEFMQGLPRLIVGRVPTTSKPTHSPPAQQRQLGKALVLDLKFEILHPMSWASKPILILA